MVIPQLLDELGRYDAAEQGYRQFLDLSTRASPLAHAGKQKFMQLAVTRCLVSLLMERDRWGEAEALLHEAIDPMSGAAGKLGDQVDILRVQLLMTLN